MTKYVINSCPTDQLIQFQGHTIRHPRFNKVIDAISLAHRRRRGLIIIGESGAGKSTILKYYEKKMYVEPTDTHDYKKVVRIKIPPSPTLKNVTTLLLQVLGDEAPGKGTQNDMDLRVARKITTLGVEMIMIDEFQDLLYSDSAKRMRTVGNYVKHLIDSFNVSVILAGLENARTVLKGHAELKRRFMATSELKAFSVREPSEFSYFQKYLGLVQKQISIDTVSLDSESMVWRMFVATNGLPGNIASIVETAIDSAGAEQKLKITDFIDAYDSVVDDPTSRRFNPFSRSAADVKKKALKGEGK
ncbi:TniB family NTP-binding protein [Amphritea sp.]|uniref:TniB family NTP-binding protein n=1 Tax=Amphritea sp. TaxID=1872502 RepID=UPI003D1282E9